MALLARFQSFSKDAQFELASILSLPPFQELIQGELALLRQQRTNASIPEPGSQDELKYVQEMRILRMRETVLDEFNQIVQFAQQHLYETQSEE